MKSRILRGGKVNFNMNRKDYIENKNSKFRNSRIGEISYNRYGSKMTIIEYNGIYKTKIRFSDGYTKVVRYEHFKDGAVTNPFDISVYGFGYLGMNIGIFDEPDSLSPPYDRWHSLVQRCYSQKQQKRQPTYIGCTVDQEWKNFQNFALWFKDNFYQIKDERMEIDKDILIKGNKVYGPDTCCFVPQKINTLFVKAEKTRGKNPIGVSYNKKDRKFWSQLNKGNGPIFLGKFDSPQEAFVIYKTEKENHIKNVAKEYKDLIPDKVYKALMNYIVEETD